MKKILSAILVCCLLVGVAFTLVSCASGDIANGTYVCEIEYEGVVVSEQTLVVKGDTISIKQMMDDENGLEMVYTYKLNDDKTEITMTYKDLKLIGDDEDVKAEFDAMKAELDEATEEELNQTQKFEETDNGFKIGVSEEYMMEYVKQ